MNIDLDLELNREMSGNLPIFDEIEEHYDYYNKVFKSKYYYFYYWVFSYLKTGSEHNKFIRNSLDAAKLAELHETIRKTINWLEFNNEKEWEVNPSSKCKKCPVIGCKGKSIEETF